MRRVTIVVAVALLAATVNVSPSAGGVRRDPWSWRQSGITGGGFQNVVAADPRDPGGFLLGGELSGFHRTSDSGARWTMSNRGIRDLAGSHAASIAFSKKHRGHVYAAAGPQRGNGVFLASKDGGATWSTRSKGPAAPKVSSLGPVCGGSDHPRATGKLIVVDESTRTRYIYVGSLNGGIKRSIDGGRTWKTIAMNGAYIRTLVADPKDPRVLYAGVCMGNGFHGAYKITGVRGTPSVWPLLSAPLTVEEFDWVDGVLYAVANTSGVFKVTNGGETWTKLGGTFFSSSSRWGAIDGAVGKTGKRVLYVAGDRPVAHGNGMYRSIAKSRNGGSTWKWMTVTAANIHKTIAGSSQTWWLANQFPSNALGKALYTPGQIAVNPRRPKTVLLSGRAGVWRSTDGGNHWRPAVRGLGATLVNAISARGSKLYVGVGDWTQFSSKNHGKTVKRFSPSSASFGYSVDISPNGTTYLGPGHRDNNTAGDVFRSPDPYASSWSDLNLPPGKRIAAIETGRGIDGDEVILAAVQGAGVWKKVGTSGWTQVATQTAVPVTGTRASLSWASPSAPYVYLAVPNVGLFRSSNRGWTWTKIWKGSALDVAGDPTASSGQRIYVQKPLAVFRIPDARNGTVEGGAIKPANVRAPQNGPIAVGPAGAVYVAGRGSPPGFYRSTNGGSSWYNHASSFYRRAALLPIDVAVSGDGYYYVALKRNGVIIGRP